MYKVTALFVCMLAAIAVKAQEPTKPAAVQSKTDTIAPAPYINKGKIAGRKAIRRSLILPGLGQVYNYGLIVKDIKSGAVSGKKIGQKLGIVGKIGAIYVAGTMLTLSYIDNNRKYHQLLTELQYRQVHNDQPDPNGSLQEYTNTEALYTAKAIYKSNREIVLVSLGLTYGLNVLDAYVTARLKYVNVDENLGFKIAPSVITSNTMYGYQSITPAFKLTLRL
jgi:hypothetical protein